MAAQITTEKAWEKSQGSNIIERTRLMVQNAREMRISGNLPPAEPEVLEKFANYVHKTGIEMLKLQSIENRSEEEIYKNQVRTPSRLRSTNEHSKLQAAEAFRRLGKLIKVDDLEIDGFAVIIDTEWNTKYWTDEMVEAACYALVMIFSDPSLSTSDLKKERASIMLETLMNRHVIAHKYVQERIEIMIAKVSNRIIRRGRVAGLLDQLYIIHRCRQRFQDELSQHNFCGQIMEMVLLEYRHAAILIQHSIRMKFEGKTQEKVSASFRPDREGFGDLDEMRKLRENVKRQRSRDLSSQWHMMRANLSNSQRKLVGGERGVSHVQEKYLKLILETISHLVGDHIGKKATANRELILKSKAHILLSSFIARPTGPFADSSIDILMNISKLPDSLEPLLHAGIVKGCLYYMR